MQPNSSWLRAAARGALIAALLLAPRPAPAQKAYDPGASDSTIRIGNLMPYSGPASAYAIVGRIEAAYFKMINDQGGINGRKIEFISYDDAYSPPKTVEQVRKLVESDEVLLTFQLIGTPAPVAMAVWVGVVSQFLPVVGTYLAGALPVLLTFIDSPGRAVAVIIAVVVYQQLENLVFVPRVTSRTMNLHPAIAFGSAIAGGASISYSTADGTARVADGDYGTAAGSLAFTGLVGETRDVVVPLVDDNEFDMQAYEHMLDYYHGMCRELCVK